MAFIRKRRSSRTRFSHAIVETYREGAQVRHRTLLNLGSSGTLQAAIEDARCRQAQEHLRRLENFKLSHPGLTWRR